MSARDLRPCLDFISRHGGAEGGVGGETGAFPLVAARDPCPCLDFISQHGGAEVGGGEFPASALLRLAGSPSRLIPSCPTLSWLVF